MKDEELKGMDEHSAEKYKSLDEVFKERIQEQNRRTSGSAFPVSITLSDGYGNEATINNFGMQKYEYYAGQALTGIVAEYVRRGEELTLDKIEQHAHEALVVGLTLRDKVNELIP